MLPLPSAPETANVAALARINRERFTTLTGTKITLSSPACEGLELVFENGALLDPGAAYTIAGTAITLTAAAITTDVFVVHYWFRGTT